MEQIPSEILTPCFGTEEDYKQGYEQSEFYVDSNYKESYRNHKVAMHHIACMAKSYILENFEKIKDWKNLEVIVIDGRGNSIGKFYNYVETERKSSKNKNSIISNLFKELDDENKARHNPIESLSDVILDPTDGDFSLTINGKEYWWIDDESIILIADYIEEQLKENI